MSLTNWVNQGQQQPIAPKAQPYRLWSTDLSAPMPIMNAAQRHVSTLAKTVLIPTISQDTLQAVKQRFNQTFSWEVARIQALMNSVLATGVVTEQDVPKLNSIEADLKKLQSELLQNNTITQVERDKAQKALTEALKLVTETGDLFKYLKLYQEQSSKLDTAREELIDKAYDPDTGNPLGSLTALQNVMNQIQRLGDMMHPLAQQPETVAGITLFDRYQQQATEAGTLIEDWSDSVINQLQRELNTLHALAKHDDEAVRRSAQSQISALSMHLSALQQRLHGMAGQLGQRDRWSADNERVAAIDQALEEAQAQALQLADRLDGFIQGFERELEGIDTSQLPDISYGSQEWDKLVAERPPQKTGWMSSLWNKTCNWLNPLGYIPERWRPSSLQLKSLFLTALSVGEQVHKYSKIPEQVAKLRLHANLMQTQVFQAVPRETVEIIDKEVGTLGKILSDNYSATGDQAKLHKMTKKSPNIRPALDAVRQQFGNEKPNAEQIKSVINAYRVQRMAQESPTANPFKHDSFSDWWTVFNKPFTATEVVDSPPVTSAASTTNGLVPSLIKSLGKLWESVNIFSSTNTIPREVQTQGYQALRSAAATLPSLQHQISQTPALAALKAEVDLLHEQLLHAVSETPEAACSLPKLAFWSQQVEDVCYALQDLEGRVAKTMEAARRDLESLPSTAMTDAELSRYGRKHMNIVKQARLIDSLGLPDVRVPMPQGISSDQVTTFLRQAAPQVFEHWKALGVLHSTYHGDKPFLESPEAADHLKAIDQAIEAAFERAANDYDSTLLPPELITLIELAKTLGEHLMVRSTGSEDSRQTANAGGNISKSYVAPERQAVIRAIGEVVRSYFGYASLQNRLNAGLNPFNEELRLAATVQELIGEPIGGAAHPVDIPVSLVLFSNEPLFTGGEEFRIMRMSVAYGHGEGVVGNLGIATDTVMVLHSLAHPDRLYISYDSQEKPERLAPVETAEGVRLQKVRNPPELASRPALSNEMIARLFHLGIVEEAYFDHHPTDMEIVIRGHTIYPVQARPINRQMMLPTYLDQRRVAGLVKSPIVDQLHGEVIVVGKGSVVQIQSPKAILSKPTLEEAERAFHKGEHQLVIVGRQEPSNSHPVVNFSGLGIPSLFVSDTGKAQEIIARVNDKVFLVADVQTAALSLWDSEKAQVDEFISEGFAVHPAKVTQSLATTADIPTGPRAVPQEIKELLLAIRTAATKDVALAAFDKLQQHGWFRQMADRKAALIEQLKITPNPVAERQLRVLKLIESQAIRVFAETRQALSREGRLQPLFHIKALEALIVGNAQSPGIAQYALADVESIASSAERVLDYQRQLPHPAHFADMLVKGFDQAPMPELSDQWQAFLLKLESLAEDSAQGKTGGITKDELKQFKDLINMLAQNDLLPAWLFSSFSKMTSMDPQTALRSLLADIPATDKGFLLSMARERATIRQMRSQVERFAQPESFEQAFAELKAKSQEFANAPMPVPPEPTWSDKLFAFLSAPTEVVTPKRLDIDRVVKTSSTTVQLVALGTMEELVNTFDAAIKAMKASPLYTNKEKVLLFRKMLQSFLEIYGQWRFLFERHEFPRSGSFYDKLSEIVNVSGDFINNEEQLTAPPYFSVAIALTSEGYYITRNLDAAFTTIHQILLVAIGCLALKSSANLALPIKLQAGVNMIQQWKENSREQQYVNVDPLISEVRVTKGGIEMIYNVALRSHSARLGLIYDKFKDQVVISADFSGENEMGRWNHIQRAANILVQAGLITLSEPIFLDELGVSVAFVAKNTDEIVFLVNEIFGFAVSSYNNNRDSVYAEMLDRIRQAGFLSKWNTYVLDRQSPLDDPRIYLAVLQDVDAYNEAFNSFSDAVKAILWSEDKKSLRLLDYFTVLIQGRLEMPGTTILEKFNRHFGPEITKETAACAVSVAKLGLLCKKKEIKQKSIVLFENLLAKGHHQVVDSVIQELRLGNSVQNERLLLLLDHLIDKGYAESVAALVRTSLVGVDLNQHKLVVKMLTLLVNKGHQYQEAGALLKKWKDGSSEQRKVLQGEIASLSEAMAKKGESIDINLEVATQLSADDQPACLAIFEALISHSGDINVVQAAEMAAIKWVKDTDGGREKAIQLLAKLVDQGRGYEPAEAALRIVFENEFYAFDLLLKLNEKGAALPLFKEIAERLNSKGYYGLYLDLYKKAASKGLHLKEATAAAVASAERIGYRYSVVTGIFIDLVKRGHAIQEAEQYAIKASKYFTEYSLSNFLNILLENGGSPQAAMRAAIQNYEATQNTYCIEILFMKKIGFQAARKEIEHLQNSSEPYQRQSCYQLKKLLRQYENE